MDTKKLRQKILDLAIHGKLVPQDPNDEPASVLLERIRAEKERLVKEGKIKKSKSSKTTDTPHYETRQVGEANVPFEVPKGWCWCKFQDCMDVRDGTHNSPKYINNGYPLITSKDFKEGRFDLSKTKYISEKDYQDIIKRSKVEVGDILYSMIGGNIGSMIRINQDNYFDMAIKNVALFKPYQNENINTKYIAYLLESKVREYQTIAIGGAQPFVGLDVFRNSLVPFPPLSEQHRIVTEIEKWFALIDAIESGKTDMQAAIKQAKSKILDLAIHGKLVPQDENDESASELLKRINPKVEITCDNGHYQNLPKGWGICKLSDLCKIENGFAFSSNDYMTEGVPLIRISNIVDNSVDLTECVYIQEKVDDRFIVTKGDLLIAMSGATTGKMGVYSYEETAYLNQRVANIRILDDSILLASYRDCFMQSKVEEILRLAYGGAQPNISANVIGNFDFLLPPIEEQRRIVNAIDKVFALLDAIMESL